MDHYIECFEGYARMFYMLHSQKTAPAVEPDAPGRRSDPQFSEEGAGRLSPEPAILPAEQRPSQPG